jgi:hypothetical protein
MQNALGKERQPVDRARLHRLRIYRSLPDLASPTMSHTTPQRPARRNLFCTPQVERRISFPEREKHGVQRMRWTGSHGWLHRAWAQQDSAAQWTYTSSGICQEANHRLSARRRVSCMQRTPAHGRVGWTAARHDAGASRAKAQKVFAAALRCASLRAPLFFFTETSRTIAPLH